MIRAFRLLFVVFAVTAGGFLVARGAPPAPGAATPAPAKCKAYGGGKCCDPAIVAHLPREAVDVSCGQSDDSYLGEQAGKDSCKYYFKVENAKPEESYVQVYAPPTRDVPPAPNDPFFTWKRVRRAFMTVRANSPKSAPMLATATGLWLPGKGYFVSVNASTRVCTRKQAEKLSLSMK